MSEISLTPTGKETSNIIKSPISAAFVSRASDEGFQRLLQNAYLALEPENNLLLNEPALQHSGLTCFGQPQVVSLSSERGKMTVDEVEDRILEVLSDLAKTDDSDLSKKIGEIPAEIGSILQSLLLNLTPVSEEPVSTNGLLTSLTPEVADEMMSRIKTAGLSSLLPRSSDIEAAGNNRILYEENQGFSIWSTEATGLADEMVDSFMTGSINGLTSRVEPALASAGTETASPISAANTSRSENRIDMRMVPTMVKIAGMMDVQKIQSASKAQPFATQTISVITSLMDGKVLNNSMLMKSNQKTFHFPGMIVKENPVSVDETIESSSLQADLMDQVSLQHGMSALINENESVLDGVLKPSEISEEDSGESVPQIDLNTILSIPQSTEKGLAAQVRETTSSTVANIDQNDVIAQIIDKAKVMVDQGNGEIEISLKPDSLGKIHLKVALENQLITAKFITESDQIKQILESSMVDLRKMLQDNGIQVQNLMVSVGQQGRNSEGFAQSNHSFNHHRLFDQEPDSVIETQSNSAPKISLGSSKIDLIA